MDKKPFSKNIGLSDDLIYWASQVNALGEAISALSCSNAGEECFSRVGDGLGMIISDYASAIYDSLEDVYGELQQTLEGYDGSKIQKLERRIKWIKSGNYSNLDLLLDQINETQKEVKPIFDDVVKLDGALFQMRDEVVSRINELRQKKAPTSNTGQEEVRAQDAEHQKLL